jgi:argonaute-like protein
MHRPKYEHLQTTAFHIADPTLLNRSYHLLRFPAKWKTPLLKLAARPDQDTPRIPIKSLNRTLIALIPDIVQVATYATRGQDPIWIVSDRRIPPQAVFAIVAAWVRTQGGATPPSWSRPWRPWTPAICTGKSLRSTTPSSFG